MCIQPPSSRSGTLVLTQVARLFTLIPLLRISASLRGGMHTRHLWAQTLPPPTSLPLTPTHTRGPTHIILFFFFPFFVSGSLTSTLLPWWTRDSHRDSGNRRSTSTSLRNHCMHWCKLNLPHYLRHPALTLALLLHLHFVMEHNLHFWILILWMSLILQLPQLLVHCEQRWTL